MAKEKLKEEMKDKAAEDTKAYREKFWIECTPDEKLERMRQIIKGLQGQVMEIRDYVEALMEHRHAPTDGSLLRPIGGSRVLAVQEFPRRYGRVTRSDEDAYF